MKKLHLAIIQSSIFVASLSSIKTAASKTWLSIDSLDEWHIAELWSPTGVPTVVDDVHIGSSVADLIIVNVLQSADANSVTLDHAASMFIDADLNVIEGIHIKGGADITLSESAKLSIGEGGLSLVDGHLYLTDPSQSGGYAEIDISGPLFVDDARSGIDGVGLINIGSSFDFNGSLRPYGGTLTLNSTGESVPATFDLDGSKDLGQIALWASDTVLQVPSEFSDPYSGRIYLGLSTELHFLGSGTTVIDGEVTHYVDRNMEISSPARAPVIDADNLILAEDSSTWVETGKVVINANSIEIMGQIDMVQADLEIDAPTEWRLSGELRSAMGQDGFLGNNIIGSPVTVGSASKDKATIESTTKLTFLAPVTLETTAELRAIQGGAFSFNKKLVLDSPSIILNSPRFQDDWLYELYPAPGLLDIKNDLHVVGSTSLIATDVILGSDSYNIEESIYHQIDPDQTLEIDTLGLVTFDTVTMQVNKNAQFSVVLRDPIEPAWINNMNMVLDDGTVSAGSVCNRGVISGAGKFIGELLASYNGEICSGRVLPGIDSKNEAGRLIFIGDTNFSSTEFTMNVGIDGSSSFDQISVDGNLTIQNAILTIDIADGYKPKRGESIEFFTFSQSQSIHFDDIHINGLPKNICYDRNLLKKRGILKFR